MSGDENNLPLLSNIKRVRARHYIWCANPVLKSRRVLSQVIIVFGSLYSCELSEKKCLQCKRPYENRSENNAKSNPYSVVKCSLCDEIFQIPVVLDMKNLNIKSVSSVACNSRELEKFVRVGSVRNDPAASRKLFSLERDELEFEVEQWSLKFECPKKLPFAIFIEYNTTEKGESLSWRNEMGNMCFFTSCSAVNNRSLLPYQDAPSALATWEAFISIDRSYHVAMSSDEPGIAVDLCNETFPGYENDQDQNALPERLIKCEYFYSSLPLPLATLAIAAGVWSVENVNFPSDFSEICPMKLTVSCRNEKSSHSDDTRLKCVKKQKCPHDVCFHCPFPCFIGNRLKIECELANCTGNSSDDGISEGPSSRNERSKNFKSNDGAALNSTRAIPTILVYSSSLSERLKPLREFLPYCLHAAGELLGPYPCPRLEIVVMPPSFASLGLSSPNLIFVAPCVAVAGDSSTFLRIAHEISHAWFGIIIGAVDWTEEWLSEGFSTFAEEMIYERATVSYRHVLRRRINTHKELTTHRYSNEILDGSCKTMPHTPTSENTGTAGAETWQSEHTLMMPEDVCDYSEKQIIASKADRNSCVNKSNLADSASTSCSEKMEANFSQGLKLSSFFASRVHKRLKIDDDGGSAAVIPNNASTALSIWEKVILSANEDIRKELFDVRCYLRFRKLTQEIEVTDENLQTLLPNRNKSADGGRFVVNGLRMDKPFLNVHYIKGFFFLKHLCDKVGKLNFCAFLKRFVLTYHGSLIKTENFLDFFCSEFLIFPSAMSELAFQWLQLPGICKQLGSMNDSALWETSLPKTHYVFWKNLNSKKGIRNYQKQFSEIVPLRFSDRIQLFLEFMLEYKGRFAKGIMQAIRKFYNLEYENSDVRHVWCELVIKHDYKTGSRAVEKFLSDDRGMGVYLYGELMISRSPFWQALAKRMYRRLKDSMDENTRRIVSEMLFPQ